MQKIVSKYALAAHLAIMAVAPLLLLPFLGSSATATVLLWLSAFGFVWVLMEPSRRRGEMPHDARARVSAAVLHDPLFWFSIALVAYAGVRALNGGISLAYDAEFMVWSVREPNLPLLPGCADESGYLCFAAVLALAVVFQGLRHALGRSARAAFLLLASFISSLVAIVCAFSVSYGVSSVVSLARYSPLNASYFGTAFGMQLLCSAVAMFDVVCNKWMRAEPFAALALVGNAIGLALFAPSFTAVVFAVAFLLQVILSFVSARGVFEGSGSFRFALAVLMTFVAPVMFALATDDLPWMAEKIQAFKNLVFFPDGFFPARDALSSISLKAWKGSPWLGTGLGSFPLDVRFMATSADWTVISSAQKTALNGWWQLLAERGVIGAGMIAVAFGMLLFTFVSRLIRAIRDIRLSPEHSIGIVTLLAMVVLAFFDCSFLRPEVLMLIGVFLAFSGGALPARRKDDRQGKEN